MIDQITVFLENDKGRLAALCRTFGDANINMHTLTLADSAQYGVARIIADSPAKAYEVLNEKGFRASLTKVFAIEIPDRAGSLATLMEALDSADINVEYAYCFASKNDVAIEVLRIDNHDDAEQIVTSAGFRVVRPEELYA
jgi:hypothetical protein